MKRMKAMLVLAALLLPVAASSSSAPSVAVAPVLSTTVTSSGQPIVLPQHNVHVIVTTYDIAAGAELPEHKHPFARYAYVLSGTLRIFNIDTNHAEIFKTGDFIVEAIGQWHRASNIGTGPVKLVVIDQVDGDQANTVMRQ
jgi:quercetin dioxygenase-like cupin family protein